VKAFTAVGANGRGSRRAAPPTARAPPKLSEAIWDTCLAQRCERGRGSHRQLRHAPLVLALPAAQLVHQLVHLLALLLARARLRCLQLLERVRATLVNHTQGLVERAVELAMALAVARAVLRAW